MNISRSIGCAMMLWLFSAFAQAPLTSKVHLSLDDAIHLAISRSYVVKNAALQRILDRYSLLMAKHHFDIIPSISASAHYQPQMKPTYQGSVSGQWNTPLGGNVTAEVDQPGEGTQSWSASLSLPILKGFGYGLNHIDLKNAQDQAYINRLNYNNTLSQAILAVIAKYWGIVQEQNALVIQQNGLKQVKQILLQYQIKYKAGRIAQRQLAQAKSEVISQAISIEQAQVSFKNNYDGLLDMINLKTSTQFTLDDQVALPKSITLPSLDHVMAIIFEHDLGYQQAKIAVTSAKRALQVSEDNMRSDLTAQVTGHSQTPHFSGSLSWSIPLDRLPLNQARSAAQIAYIEAQHAFLDKRSALKTEINTLYSNYLMAKRQLKLVEEKADYEKLNYHAMSEREHFGRVSSFELFSNYNTMINAKSAVMQQKIQLLTAFLTLKQRMGQLLDYFDILLPDSGD